MRHSSFANVALASAASCVLALSLAVAPALAQSSGGHSGSGSGSGSGQSGTHGQQGGGSTKGQGGSSTRGTPGKGLSSHVFEEGEGPSADAKGPKYGGGRASTGKPANAGVKKGDVYGDQWVILRDANGVPILNAAGFVQPLDKDGNLIPLDAAGAPLDVSLVVAVELGRTNVSRANTKVLDRQLTEAIKSIGTADSVALDSSGRLVVTKDGVASTIDSPIENLAIYKSLLSTGSLPNLTDEAKAKLAAAGLSYLADGVKTADDLKAAAGFLAGATDKAEPLSLDEIQYLNQTLGIPGTITGADGKTYVDYSSFTYDRAATYGDMTAKVLVQTSAPGVEPVTYAVQTINVYQTVLGGAEVTASNAAAFADAADDARAVLLYLHDNAPKTEPLTETSTATSAIPK